MDRDSPPGGRLLYLSGDPAASDACLDAIERRPSLSVVVAGGVEEGLDRIERGTIDLVVSTHGGEVDGVGFLRAVRDRAPALPFVLVADETDGMALSRAVAAGVSGYVPRGAAGADRLLVDRVEALIGRDTGDRPGEDALMPIDDLGVRERLRLKERAMEEAPVGITISDIGRPDNPLIYLNDAFEALTGYPPEETVGRNCRFLQGEATDPAAVATMREAIDDGEAASVELVNYRKDGEPFWNEVDIAPVRDDGEVTHYVGFQTDVTARKEAELEARRERRNLEHLLARIEGLLGDVTRGLVRATSRAEVERTVCERLAAVDTYAFAWIGEPTRARDAIAANAWAGRWEPGSAGLETDLGGAEGDRSPTARAHETGETVVVDEPDRLAALAAATPWIGAAALGGVAAIPLSYGETRYGVLTVYTTREGALDERELVVLEALARATATAINAHERGRLLGADNVVEIEVEIRHRDLFFVDLSAREDCDVEYDGSVYLEDGSVLLFFTTDASPSAVESIAADHPEVEAVTLVNEHADGNLFEFTVAEPSLVTALAERGASTRSMTAVDGTGRVSLDLPTEADARAILDLVRERYPGTELVSYRERERPPETKGEFLADLEDSLTDRQLTALQTAYVGGFYEWNRPVSGDELPASMGIARSTFHQHLRAAERKLVAEFFDR